MTDINERPRCGSLKTKNNQPCGIVVLPCRYHDCDGKQPPPKKVVEVLSPRQERFATELARGKSPQEAGKLAGYKGTSLTGHVYRLAQSPEVTERVRHRMNLAHSLDNNEIVGSLVDDMRSSMYDLLPDNEIVKEANERGKAHLIKHIEMRTRYIPQGTGKEPIKEVTTKLKMYSRHEASKQLASILNMNDLQSPGRKAKAQFDRAVDTAIERLKQIGDPWTRDQVVAKLREMMVSPIDVDDEEGTIIPATNAQN